MRSCVRAALPSPPPQGTSDSFLATQLAPDALEAAAKEIGYPLSVRMQVRFMGCCLPAHTLPPITWSLNLLTPRSGPAVAACRTQKDYDHSYFFISTFVGEHLAFHAKALAA